MTEKWLKDIGKYHKTKIRLKIKKIYLNIKGDNTCCDITNLQLVFLISKQTITV